MDDYLACRDLHDEQARTNRDTVQAFSPSQGDAHRHNSGGQQDDLVHKWLHILPSFVCHRAKMDDFFQFLTLNCKHPYILLNMQFSLISLFSMAVNSLIFYMRRTKQSFYLVLHETQRNVRERIVLAYIYLAEHRFRIRNGISYGYGIA